MTKHGKVREQTEPKIHHSPAIVAVEDPKPAAPAAVKREDLPPPRLRPMEREEAKPAFGLLLKHADTATFAIENLSFDEFMERIWDSQQQYAYEADGAVRAIVNIALRDPHSRTAEMGVVALEPGKGFGGPACLAAVRFAFKTLGLARLFCIVNEDNERCMRYLEKMGIWTHEGTFRSNRLKDGKVYDQHIYSVLSREQDKWGEREGG